MLCLGCCKDIGSHDGRAEKHGCGGNGFAASSWVDDACDPCDAAHVQTEPRTAGDSVAAPRASSKIGAAQSPDHPGAKFLAQEIEDSEDELIAGTGEDARQQQQQQQQQAAWENPCRSVQWMNERDTQNSCEVAIFSCLDS